MLAREPKMIGAMRGPIATSSPKVSAALGLSAVHPSIASWVKK